MNTRILSIIIVYNPNIDLLLTNIKSFVEYIDLLLIWENSTLLDEQKEIINLISPTKIIFHNEGQNKGISYPLNYAWKYAQQYSFDYLLTMDQDSIWIGFKSYLNHCLNISKSQKAIFGPNLLSIENHNQIYRPIDHVITSGCLISIDALNHIGGYNTNFFVDGIDVELCYRAKKYGYNIFQIGECQLKQKFGAPQKVNLLGFKFTTSNYSAERLYNILCNHICIMRKYGITRTLCKQVFNVYILKFTIKIILGEKDKWNKIKAIYKGIWKGLITKI